MKLSYVYLVIFLALLAAPSLAKSKQLKVAVASNFVFALTQLKDDFERQSGVELQLSSGSTGLLAAQVQRGAPFDVFFAADQDSMAKLKALQLVSEPQTYAVGRLVLWQPKASVEDWQTWLKAPIRELVVAEPKLAPYGAAAQQVISFNNLVVNRRIVANNINQAFHFVDSGNADAGLLAESSLVLAFLKHNDDKYRRFIRVPQSQYRAIKQDVAIVLKSQNQRVARQLTNFILAPKQQAKLAHLGYQPAGKGNG